MTTRAEIERALSYLYWSAYHAGHHDTVESQYTDVVVVDRFDYWTDAVQECLAGGDMSAIDALLAERDALTERDRVLSEACDNELAAHLRCRAERDALRELMLDMRQHQGAIQPYIKRMDAALAAQERKPFTSAPS